MRHMYDGINTDVPYIPLNAQIVAGYVDGLYIWTNTDWNTFPNAIKVRIAVFSATNDGHVLDRETGNATAAQSVNWVLMRRSAGIDPTIYVNMSSWQEVRDAFHARNVKEPHYWVAQYDGIQIIPDGAIGKQYQNYPNYDISVIADYWPGIDPPPKPTITYKDDDMILHFVETSNEVWALSGPLYWHITDTASLASYQATGTPQAHITQAEHQSILNAITALTNPHVTVDVTTLKFPTFTVTPQ
jgi:hypothetical protein